MTNKHINRIAGTLLAIVMALGMYQLVLRQTVYVCTFQDMEQSYEAAYSQIVDDRPMVLVSRDDRYFLFRRDRLEECVEK